MKITPLPCPWCGAIPTVGPPDESTAGDCFGYVTCENPECSVNPESEDRREVNGNEGREHYRQMAVANWNLRMNNNFIKGQQTRIHAAQHAEDQRDRLAEAAAKIRLFVTESKESADYWFSASECQCVSPQPIGSCLACDMAGISLGAEEALATLDRKEAE